MKNLDYAFLLDIYGNILTDKQRSVMELYYWEDLSLGEISECEGITRQAVRDSVKRSEQIFEDFESKLGFSFYEKHSKSIFYFFACTKKRNKEMRRLKRPPDR